MNMVKRNEKFITYLQWAEEEKNWINRGKQMLLGGIRYHKIDLNTDVTEQKSLVLNILNNMDKTLVLLETIDESSSEEYTSTLFKNVMADIENIKQDTEIFLTSSGFSSMNEVKPI